MRLPLVLAAVVSLLVLQGSAAGAEGKKLVALVTAETSNEVLAVSLGPHGGHVLRRVHLGDPLMIAAPLHGPAVVVNPSGTVTLLAWHTLRPIAVLQSFRSPKVAAIAPGGRLAYVTDEKTGKLSVIDLARRKVVGRVYVGLQAHHLAISPDGTRIWVALGETATTIVRLDSSNPRRPRVIGRFHPRYLAHDVRFEPNGRMVWIGSARSPVVGIYDAESGRIFGEGAEGGRAPQHVAFSGRQALITSGYGSSLTAMCWRAACRRRVVPIPYGSFNLATYGGFVVTTSLFTGQVSEFRVRDLHRLWTTKVAPAARYVAISLWPG
jgi:hypothetical protein